MSSEDQNLARQKKQLLEIGMDIIFEEKISGATMNRLELQNMLKEIKCGDVIYVTDLTRITRSTHDLFSLIDFIRTKRANLKSLKEI
ncbi:MAG: recombinase family protein [Cetobacterium sp.]